MSTEFPTLLSTLRLRGTNLKNRIVFGAHTVNMSHEGLPGDRHFGYYRERARGGAAMIVVEPVPVHRTGVLNRGNLTPDSDDIIAPFRRITDECHEHGTVMIHQLYHVGGHGDQDNSWQPYWSPSGFPSMHDPWGSHKMTDAEIEEVIEGFVAAALRDQRAGFDGVDIFAAYNCLVDQFWSPLTNRRDDKWGGGLENRMRFAVEVLHRIRAAAGEDFIIGLTVSDAEPAKKGLSLDDKVEIVSRLDEMGLIDYVSCGTGSYLNDPSRIIPTFHYDMKLGVPVAEAYKAAVKHAKVTAESRIKTPANAEAVLANQGADLVSIVRGQIADPHFANKAKADASRDIRPCISCNQLCIGRRARDYASGCLVNPSVAREVEWGGDGSGLSEVPKQILVVGGGPAGIEMARVAAERGHSVRLVDAGSELGGQFRLAAGQPERGEIGVFLNWGRDQLKKWGVDIQLGTHLSADDITASNAEVVVLATGSQPDRSGFQRALLDQDELPGVHQDNVSTIHDVLDGSVIPGSSVLLLDDMNGWWPASGTALHLAMQRHFVTLVTWADKAAAKLDQSMTGGTTRERFMRFGVEVLAATAVKKWVGTTATLLNLYTGDIEEREFDSLVLALTNKPDTTLADALSGSAKPVHVIGDALAPRTAHMAIFEARKLALSL